MKLAFYTRPFADEPLDAVIDFAAAAQIPGLEVMAHPGSPHIDPVRLAKAEALALRKKLDARHLYIASLSWYTGDLLQPGKTAQTQEGSKKLIDAAVLLGVDMVCFLAGFADDGRSKLDVIEKDLLAAWTPVLAHAEERGVCIAIENYYRSLIEGLDTFEALFQAISHEHFGLNYDPSHLVHQGCDYLAPLKLYPERVFQVHAKDVVVKAAHGQQAGAIPADDWRYALPGLGVIDWAELLGVLKANGYSKFLSIEHEDREAGRETGFGLAARHLEASGLRRM